MTKVKFVGVTFYREFNSVKSHLILILLLHFFNPLLIAGNRIKYHRHLWRKSRVARRLSCSQSEKLESFSIVHSYILAKKIDTFPH